MEVEERDFIDLIQCYFRLRFNDANNFDGTLGALDKQIKEISKKYNYNIELNLKQDLRLKKMVILLL